MGTAALGLFVLDLSFLTIGRRAFHSNRFVPRLAAESVG